MVMEASKTNQLRGPDYFDTYFVGTVLDIGCGDDPVTPTAVRFDLADGDAERIDAHFPAAGFDCVHSSHCLEHMRDPVDALGRWWSLVRPGGYLVVVVPHEDLYEQGIWPSIFNTDHKATFRVDGDGSWSPVSHKIDDLIAGLGDAETVSVRVMDAHYDRSMMGRGIGVWGRLLHRLNMHRAGVVQRPWVQAALQRRGLTPLHTEELCNRLLWHLGGVPDQTVGRALAQIEMVVHKRRRGPTTSERP